MAKLKGMFPIIYSLDWSYTTIEQIRKDLDEIEKLGATDVEIEIEDYYGSSSIKITSKGVRLETDEEEKERTRKQEEREKAQRVWELKQLKELQEKYGKQ